MSTTAERLATAHRCEEQLVWTFNFLDGSPGSVTAGADKLDALAKAKEEYAGARFDEASFHPSLVVKEEEERQKKEKEAAQANETDEQRKQREKEEKKEEKENHAHTRQAAREEEQQSRRHH